ncbi:MAG TPA: ATP-binding protein, partial [Vicinamibacteria bacterium]
EHNKVSGTGLGLYICRLLVEGHGGQMWVESEIDRGSTFGMSLPVDARIAQRPLLPAEREPAPSDSPAADSPTEDPKPLP